MSGVEKQIATGYDTSSDEFLLADDCDMSSRLDVPHEFAEYLDIEFGEDDREGLAVAAAVAAVSRIGEAYQNPHVRDAALTAARMALGLKPMIEEGER